MAGNEDRARRMEVSADGMDLIRPRALLYYLIAVTRIRRTSPGRLFQFLVTLENHSNVPDWTADLALMNFYCPP